ncbi:MAG: hypothetical protein JWO94_1771, partial [Verrucomicrobiaceae bacterium]|nr:hypothetical protein [Verrucomicrobiaceae bacterium]
MLCMAERLFPSYGLWQQFAATGAHLLWRAKTCIALRSKRPELVRPELVRQEFWGMIPAHYLMRKMMAQAALA